MNEMRGAIDHLKRDLSENLLLRITPSNIRITVKSYF